LIFSMLSEARTIISPARLAAFTAKFSIGLILRAHR
jgi:hypothetical protein